MVISYSFWYQSKTAKHFQDFQIWEHTFSIFITVLYQYTVASFRSSNRGDSSYSMCSVLITWWNTHMCLHLWLKRVQWLKTQELWKKDKVSVIQFKLLTVFGCTERDNLTEYSPFTGMNSEIQIRFKMSKCIKPNKEKTNTCFIEALCINLTYFRHFYFKW